MLGAGKDGTVLKVPPRQAIKFFSNDEVYYREKQAYRRLYANKVRYVGQFEVPQLIRWYDDLLAIEMTVVKPPFILDFASAYLDARPNFPDDVNADADERIHDFFGDRAPDVFALLHELGERHGVWMLDARPANIQF